MQKRERQKRIESIILKENRGWRQAELARRLGVHRSTIGRDIQEMIPRIPFYEKNGLLYINHSAYLSSISLNLHEIMTLHLLTQSIQGMDGHILSIQNKISNSLKLHSPEISDVLKHTTSMHDRKKGKAQDKKTMKMMEKLQLAWLEHRKIQIQYSKEGESCTLKGAVCHMEKDFLQNQLNILFIEGTSIDCLVLDTQCIESVRLLNEEVQIPESFSIKEHIRKCKDLHLASVST